VTYPVLLFNDHAAITMLLSIRGIKQCSGFLSETDKSCLDAFSERQNDVVFAILISSSPSSLIEQIANSLNKFSSVIVVLTLFFQALAFLIPAIHLYPEDISSPCPN